MKALSLFFDDLLLLELLSLTFPLVVSVPIEKSAFTRASQDRQGVNVSHAESGLDFGIVPLAEAKKGVQSELLVSTDNDASVTLVSADVISAGGASSKNRKRMPSVRQVETLDWAHLISTSAGSG